MLNAWCRGEKNLKSTSKANAIPQTKSISVCVWYWWKLNGNEVIWYAAAGISSDGNTVLSCNIKHVAAWSSFCAVCRGLSFHSNGKCIIFLIRKERLGRDDRLNSGGDSLLLLSAQLSVQSSCFTAVSTWNGSCHLVGHRLQPYLPASSKRSTNMSLHSCIIAPATFYVRKHAEGAKALCVFPTLALRGHQSEEICLLEASSFLNTVGCGLSCQKGISTVPCRLNKPWPDPKFGSPLCMHVIEK